MKFKKNDKVKFEFEPFSDDELYDWDGNEYNAKECFDFELELLADVCRNVVFTVEWCEMIPKEYSAPVESVKLVGLDRLYPTYVLERIDG